MSRAQWLGRVLLINAHLLMRRDVYRSALCSYFLNLLETFRFNSIFAGRLVTMCRQPPSTQITILAERVADVLAPSLLSGETEPGSEQPSKDDIKEWVEKMFDAVGFWHTELHVRTHEGDDAYRLFNART